MDLESTFTRRNKLRKQLGLDNNNNQRPLNSTLLSNNDDDDDDDDDDENYGGIARASRPTILEMKRAMLGAAAVEATNKNNDSLDLSSAAVNSHHISTDDDLGDDV